MQTPSTVEVAPPVPTDRTWTSEEDVESSEAVAPNESHARTMPSVRLLVCLTALGFTLALGYRYSGLTPQQLWPFTPAPVAAQPAATELARTMRELDALKKSVGELTTENQQLAAAVTALKAGQQAIQQRVASAQFQGWHSIPPAMKFRMIAIQPKETTGSIASHPTAMKAVAARPSKPIRNAPLPLTPPQP